MAAVPSPRICTETEKEARFFSEWNWVATFFQALILSSLLFETKCNPGESQNSTFSDSFHHRQFKAISYSLKAWLLQSIGLAFLLLYAVRKRSYNLCYLWIIFESLLTVNLIISGMYIAYLSYLEIHFKRRYPQGYYRSREVCGASPGEYMFLFIVHIIVKGYGFFPVRDFIKLIRTTNFNVTPSALV